MAKQRSILSIDEQGLVGVGYEGCRGGLEADLIAVVCIGCASIAACSTHDGLDECRRCLGFENEVPCRAVGEADDTTRITRINRRLEPKGHIDLFGRQLPSVRTSEPLAKTVHLVFDSNPEQWSCGRLIGLNPAQIGAVEAVVVTAHAL